MEYGNLNFLYLLPLIPVLIVGYIFVFRQKRNALRRFAQSELIGRLLFSVSTKRQVAKASFLVVAILFLIFTLVQPKWGYHWEEVHRKGIDIMIAIDTSRSMLADDVKPNRLGAAGREVKALLNVLGGDRIGLVAFAGTAFIGCPLTSDYGAFRLFLDDLDTNTIPQGGTAIGEAIRKAISGFEGRLKKHKAIILITDGEDHGSQPMEAAKEAKERGIVIYTVGIGKRDGSYISITNEKGEKVLLKDRAGQVVKSRLDETMLTNVALETGGAYVPAYGVQWGLEKIYTERIARMEERELSSHRVKRYENRYQIPLFVALLLIVLESFTSGRKNRE
jgi:Ca-activated chloride channel family protein